MAEMREPGRRVEVGLVIEGVDVSRDVAPFLLSLTFTDNEGGEADDLQVELEDSQGRFRGNWFPARNSSLAAEIRVKNWRAPGDCRTLKCGSFEIDEIESKSYPSTLRLKGVSAPVTSPGRREKKTRAWENARLSVIAGDVASRAGLALRYLPGEDPLFDRIDQKEESDLGFVRRAAERVGLSVKVVDRTLVVYDEQELEKAPPVRTVALGVDDVKEWSLKTQSGDVYQKAEVGYQDPLVKARIEGEAVEEDKIPSGHTLKINARVKSPAEARMVAEKALWNVNRREVTGSMTLMGDPDLVMGVNLRLSGFGTWDGTYRVTKAQHEVSPSGYSVKLDLEAGRDARRQVRRGGGGSAPALRKARTT